MQTPKPALSEDQKRRLAFIRYLHSLSLSHAKGAGVKASPALLTLHDAVEMFLQLAGEYLNAAIPPRADFDKYFPPLCEALGVPSLPRQPALQRMNKSRVNLKHQGLHPTTADLATHLRAGTEFFEEATPLLFNLPFDGLTLVEFVEPPEAREALLRAVDLTGKGELRDAAGQASVAFAIVLRRRSTAMGWLPKWPFAPMDLHGMADARQLAAAVKYTNEVRDVMGDAVEILALGIDFKRYVRFLNVTPKAYRMGDGRWHASWGITNAIPTSEEIEECVSFVIDCALAS